MIFEPEMLESWSKAQKTQNRA